VAADLLSDALAEASNRVNQHPYDAEAYILLGIVLNQAGRKQEAESTFKRAATVTPTDARTWINLGIVLDRLDRHAERGLGLLLAAQLNPTNIRAQLGLGVVLSQLNPGTEATYVFQEVIALYGQLREDL
jgi:Flp pilus assembly protein TadD